MWESRTNAVDPNRLRFVWQQVVDDITAMIDSGELDAGSRLPTELELAEIYGVARNTIRRAVQDLAERGVIVVMHGRGTFIGPAS